MTLRDSLARILRRLSRNTQTQARRTRRRLLLENMEERRLMAIDLQLMTASDGMAVYGAAAGDWSGASVSRTGDVNGDGFDDMLVGALYSNSGAKLEAGASYLIYGGPSLPGILDLANLGSAGVKILGADSSDGSGAAVTAADMNADGFADLIIGSPTADGINNNRPNSGETYVIFGGASLPSVIDLSVAGSASLTIYGAGNGDQSGSALANAGDVNGDGYADLIIGASSADGLNNLKSNSGETYLIYGATTLPASIDLANLQVAQGTTFYGVDAGDASGYSVAGAGDVNGDGLSDLLIGAVYGSGENNSTRTADTGESYLIFGSTSLPSVVDLTTLGNTTLGIAGVKIYGADANELSGVSVSGAGDVNGDGLDDFLIGSFLSDGPTNLTFAVGLTNLIYGASDLPGVLNLSNLGSRGISMYGSNYFDSVGWAVSAAGDVNADGFDDLLIGASYPSDQPNASYTAKGKTFVVYGASNLNAQINLSTLASAGIEYIGGDTGDTSGWSVAGVGDVNGDGFSDFLIGAPTADAGNNAKSSAGESYLLYGGRQASGVTVPGTANSDSLSGSAVADIMNGARNNDTLVSAGGADVLFGGQGNDTFDISDLNFRQISGGNGTDTLRVSATNLNVDLTLLANNRLRSIEQIDLRGAGSNTLKLNALELLNLSNESNTLVVYRDSADTIDFGSGWTTAATETIGQDLFQIYTQGAATLKVQIPNQAPAGIQLTNVVTELPENTDTSSPIKLADIIILDDGQGVNTLSLSGLDANHFEIVQTSGGTALYLRAGVVLDAQLQASLDVVLSVDDASVGAGPDSSLPYTLSINAVATTVVLTVDKAEVTGMLLSTLTNTGTWSTSDGSDVVLTASIGTLIAMPNGTWHWSYTPRESQQASTVLITASNSVARTQASFMIAASVGVLSRSIFYNNTTGAMISSAGSADAAIDPSKEALVTPGVTSSFHNYSNYSRGLNGIILDIAGLPSGVTTNEIQSSLVFALWNGINPTGFTPLGVPPSIAILEGSGQSASTRVKIVFPDNAVQNTWMRVTVKANSWTGLPVDDVFYFGHVLGEVNVGNSATRYRVNSVDVSAITENRKLFANSATIDDPYDLNKDGRVNSVDAAIATENRQLFGVVAPLTVPYS